MDLSTKPAVRTMSRPHIATPMEEARPSASILLISPTNQILLLKRVQTSTAFPSAHVFPGGNLAADQDGDIPGPDDPRRHEDAEVYRLGAIRECFEESGIVLARRKDDGRLLEVGDDERMSARKAVHGNAIRFIDWLAEQGGVADTDGLIPFTRFITPAHLRRRYTTQMYLYFLPLAAGRAATSLATGEDITVREAIIPAPTSDGGVEHTAAQFLSPRVWLALAQTASVLLLPPQFLLLHLLSQYLTGAQGHDVPSPVELQRQRDALMQFLPTGDPPWAEKSISPAVLPLKSADGRAAYALDYPGPELEGTERKGDWDRVILGQFTKEGGLRGLEVKWRAVVEKEDAIRRKADEKL
ncbi:MAG: Nucleoside diphosphate-linked moiety X motif 19, mitochondrial [Thelocarpon superellum]|nr:MAG: Nucleoside diphosphate-linked moiety X motif 19, mitochondrial [Thelocarpon superellum]